MEGHVPIDDVVAMAKRELTAFVRAVNELFGPEQAQLSADGWIEELLSLDFLVESRIPDWRRITIIASSRLTSRSIKGGAPNSNAFLKSSRRSLSLDVAGVPLDRF
jgi:hypothetical protein